MFFYHACVRVSLWMHSHIISLVVAAGSRPQTYTLPWKRTDTNAHQYRYGNNRFYVCSTSILGILSLLGVFSLHMTTQSRLLFKPPLQFRSSCRAAWRALIATESWRSSAMGSPRSWSRRTSFHEDSTCHRWWRMSHLGVTPGSYITNTFLEGCISIIKDNRWHFSGDSCMPWIIDLSGSYATYVKCIMCETELDGRHTHRWPSWWTSTSPWSATRGHRTSRLTFTASGGPGDSGARESRSISSMELRWALGVNNMGCVSCRK